MSKNNLLIIIAVLAFTAAMAKEPAGRNPQGPPAWRNPQEPPARQNPQEFRERPDAETEAKKLTAVMKDSLNLDEKICKKVQKINLKFTSVLYPSQSNGNGGGMGGPRGGMGGPGGGMGGPGGGMGGPGGGMGGPGGGMGGPGGNMGSSDGSSQGGPGEMMKESLEKAKIERENSLMKILTEDQFNKWIVLEMAREEQEQKMREEEMKKMKEMFENMGNQR